MVSSVWLCSFCVLLFCHLASPATFADTVRRCKPETKKQLNKCLKEALESIRPHLHTGIPDVNIPVLEPMYIDKLLLEDHQDIVSMNAVMTDVYIYGLSRFILRHLYADPNADTVDIALDVPTLYLNGTYNISGTLSLFVPFTLRGNGPFWVHLDRITGRMLGHLQTYGREPDTRLRLARSNLDFDVGRVNLHLQNLFNGNEILGDVVNEVLNENSILLLEEMKPILIDKLKDLVTKVLDDAFTALPVAQLFSDLPERGPQ